MDRIPPNLRFQIDDVESEWTFPISQPFDYIFIRSMAGSIASWPRLLKQSYDHLAPGAWIELSDGTWATSDDDSLPETSAYAEFQRRLQEASEVFGKSIGVAPEHHRRLVEAGFEDVVEVVRKVRGIRILVIVSAHRAHLLSLNCVLRRDANMQLSKADARN